MTQQTTDRAIQVSGPAATQSIPPFKPVALPALAAAVRVAQPQPATLKSTELPAILRKEAMLD